MTAPGDDYYPDDALPFHYRDNGQACNWAGHVLAYCPNGCDHAPHYANDGHKGCEEVSDAADLQDRRLRDTSGDSRRGVQ